MLAVSCSLLEIAQSGGQHFKAASCSAWLGQLNRLRSPVIPSRQSLTLAQPYRRLDTQQHRHTTTPPLKMRAITAPRGLPRQLHSPMARQQPMPTGSSLDTAPLPRPPRATGHRQSPRLQGMVLSRRRVRMGSRAVTLPDRLRGRPLRSTLLPLRLALTDNRCVL